MNILSGRRQPARLLVAATAAVAAAVATGSAAQAADPAATAVGVTMPNVTVVAGGSVSTQITFTGPPGVAVVLHHATLTVEVTGLADLATATVATGHGCMASDGVITCALRDGYYGPGAGPI